MRRQEESGSAAVLVLVLAAVVGACAVGGLVAGSVLVGSRRAAAAADLAALAAAGSLQGHALPAAGAPCGRAGEVAEANSARLVGCEVRGEVVTVRVVVAVRPLRWLDVDLPGSARAGPAEVDYGAWGRSRSTAGPGVSPEPEP